MNYSLGSSFNVDDMFLNFPYNKLKINCKECKQINGNINRDVLVKLIFRDSVELILNDVIENDITFCLPTGAKQADIHMQHIQDENFTEARKNGKFKEVDFLKSYFTGYLLGLFSYGSGRTKVKNIYVDPKLKQKITNYTNSGKAYS